MDFINVVVVVCVPVCVLILLPANLKSKLPSFWLVEMTRKLMCISGEIYYYFAVWSVNRRIQSN